MSQVQRYRNWIFTFVFLAVLIQFWTLEYPGLNGDEANYLFVQKYFHQFLSGDGIDLNPMVKYSGPINYWWGGLIYAFSSVTPLVKASAWMVRSSILIPALAGVAYLYRELKKGFPEVAIWFLFATVTSPLVLVYSRTAWSSGIAFAAMFFLLAEALRAFRLSEVRFIRFAIAAGLAVDAHPIAFTGMAAIFFPLAPILFRSAKRIPLKFLFAVFVGGCLSYSVLRNFPPPFDGGMPSESFFLQVRCLLNCISGSQPYSFFFGDDPAHTFFVCLYLIFTLFLFYLEFRALWKSKLPRDRILLKVAISHLVFSLYVLVMSTKGRSLKYLGTERYFLTIVPGWLVLHADAYQRFFRYFETKKKARQLYFKIAGQAVLVLIFCFSFGRFGYTLLKADGEKDPSLLAAEWLEANCPRESCLAYAENYWNYWPIRYYSRDSMDLNFIVYNWVPVEHYQPNGRLLAGCWFSSSPNLYHGSYSTRVEFKPQMARDGQVCFKGISGI